MTGSGMSPCAACKLLRRRCTRDCVFAPYFPPDEPQKFANVHKVFGAANVNKMLQVSFMQIVSGPGRYDYSVPECVFLWGGLLPGVADGGAR